MGEATTVRRGWTIARAGTEKRNSWWLVVAAWLIALVLASQYVVPRLVPPTWNLYLVQPLLWSSLSALVVWRWLSEAVHPPLPARWLVGAGALAATLQVALLILAGLLAGFGYSPYARQPLMMALNVWYLVTQLCALELARWYLLTSLGKRTTSLAAVVTWFLLFVAAVPLSGFAQMDHANLGIQFGARTLLPTATEGLLATYLAWLGGPVPALAYRGTLLAFEWLSPILPNLNWTLAAFVGVSGPVAGVLVVRDMVNSHANAESAVGETTSSDATTSAESPEAESSWDVSTGWVLATFALVFLFWFNTGLFGVRPALISGVSMEPGMKAGDIAIVRQVPASSIVPGDVIRFRLPTGASVLHRVKRVENQSAGRRFITQGDNVRIEDSPVSEQQLEGRLVLLVPKVGWVVIWLKELIGYAL